jgi:aminotransferase
VLPPTDGPRSALDAAGLERRTRGISARARQSIVSPIKEMALLADTVPGVVSLGWGLPSFATPPHIREAARQSLIDDAAIGKYPHIRGLPELREAIAVRFQQQSGVQIDPDQEILVTVGAQQALFSALMTIIDPGDEVIIPSPCFSSYIDQTILAGGLPVFVSLVEEEGWRLDVDGVASAITPRTKAIVLNFPVNPTGTMFSDADLRAVARLAPGHGIYIITDETYRFLVYDGIESPSLLAIPELRDWLISCYSFSKEYAMTGWRVGYLRAEAGLIQEIMKIHDASVITAPRISQKAALAAITGPQDCVAYFREELDRRRVLTCARLDALSSLFEYHRPTGAYYVFPRIKGEHVDPMAFALRLLHEAKVVAVPGSAFGPSGRAHLRLCFAVSPDEIVQSFDRIQDFASRQP